MQRKMIWFGAGGGVLLILAMFGSKASVPDAALATRIPMKEGLATTETRALASLPKLVVEPKAESTSIPLVKEIEPPKVETMTRLPNGNILIENKKATLRYADGRTEERFVKITAKPVQKPMKRVTRTMPQ